MNKYTIAALIMGLIFSGGPVVAKGNSKKFNQCRSKASAKLRKEAERTCTKKHGKKFSSAKSTCTARLLFKYAKQKSRFAHCEKFRPRTSKKSKQATCKKKMDLEIKRARQRYGQCLRR